MTDLMGNTPPPGVEDAPTNPDDPMPDIATGLKAWFKIGASIGTSVDKMADALDRWTKWNRRLQRKTPVYTTIPAAAVCPASGPFLLAFGAPDEGTQWVVRACRVGGTDVNVAAAGTAGLYASAFEALAGAGLTNARDYASAFPHVGFYGGGQFVVNDAEFVFLVIYGGTPGQQYAANLSVEVINVANLSDVTAEA